MTLLPKKLLLASLPLLAAVMPVYAIGNGDNDNEVIRSVVYEPGDYGSRFYRIPAIVTLNDGSLVSVADKRINNIADLPNDIDVVCRRSTDGGRSWSEYITVARHDSIGGYGDPALVCDRNSGDLPRPAAALAAYRRLTPQRHHICQPRQRSHMDPDPPGGPRCVGLLVDDSAPRRLRRHIDRGGSQPRRSGCQRRLPHMLHKDSRLGDSRPS